jgi:hypothetical protein
MGRTILMLSLILIFSCQHKKQKEGTDFSEPSFQEIYGFALFFKSNDELIIGIDPIEYGKKEILKPDSDKDMIIELPDGYCYVNRDTTRNEIHPIPYSTKIIMQKFSYDSDGNFRFNQVVSVDELSKEIEKKGFLKFSCSPFKIGIENHKIVSIEEIYIP